MKRRWQYLIWLTALLVTTSIAQETPYGMQQPYWPNQFNGPGFRPLPDSNARGTPSDGKPEQFPRGYGTHPGMMPSLRYPTPWGSPGQGQQPTWGSPGQGQQPTWGSPGQGQQPTWGVPGQRQQPAWQAPGQRQQPYRYETPAPRASTPQLVVIYPTRPVYVQQTLVLTLEVSSDTNLKEINPVLPSSDALVFRKIGNWDARTKTDRNGQTKIVNRLHYLVTPVQSGQIDLGRIGVEGKLTNGRSFSALNARTTAFEVRPPVDSVRPWLPMAEFDVSARLTNEGNLEEGKPVKLIIEQKATGVTGNQLPSLESQLRQGEYRLYLEDTQHTGQLTDDGRLVGTRADTFTLVALPNRELLIPTITLTWWNTTTNKRESSILPSRLLSAPGGLMANLSERFGGDPFVSGSSWVFWLPLTVFAFLIGMYWTWIWAKGRRFGERFRLHLVEQLNPAHTKVGRFLARLSPRRHMHNLRRIFADSLPRSSRLWYCVRVADQESDPAIWSLALRFLVQRRLKIPAQVPMSKLADAIIDIHPAADADKIRSLLYELNGAVFGNNKIEDFERWKRDFKAQVRPRLSIPSWIKQHHGLRSELPVLNP